MDAVVSLLASPHYTQVADLWAELAAEFGVRGVYVTPYPHFSYQVAAGYDRGRLELILQQVAQATAPFSAWTGGLGIFTGAQPVLTIALARSPALARLQLMLDTALAPLATGASPYYRPAAWLPHITIGFGDVAPAVLGAIVQTLAMRDFNWEIAVTNLALLCETGGQQVVQARFAFGATDERDGTG